MTAFAIRQMRIPDDFARVAEIFTATSPEPTSAEELAEREPKLNKESIRRRFVAVDGDDYPLAVAGGVYSPWHKKGKFWSWLHVDPAHQNQGIGTALAEAVEQFARENGGTRIECEIRDNDPKAEAFMTKRGYVRRRHLFESTLDLTTFDETRFAGVIDGVEATGLRILSLAEVDGPELERRLYDAITASVLDIPGWENTGISPYEEWRRFTLEGEGAHKDCVIFALDGDRVAGITIQKQVKGTGAMYTDYTGVMREYRGRNLSLAIKLKAAEAGRRHGAPYMRTNNDAENVPMLTVNRKLGYVPAPGVYVRNKEL